MRKIVIVLVALSLQLAASASQILKKGETYSVTATNGGAVGSFEGSVKVGKALYWLFGGTAVNPKYITTIIKR